MELYTEEEFNEIRKTITDLFEDDKLKCFNIKKSTYQFSQKYNWIIQLQVKLSYDKSRNKQPEETLDSVSYMINKVNSFVSNNNFKLIDMGTNKGFNFSFEFQPIQEVAKDLLKNESI